VVVCPIKGILYEGEEVSIIEEGGKVGPLTMRVWDALTDIQVGREGGRQGGREGGREGGEVVSLRKKEQWAR